jgi:hypothetical protein
MLGNQIRWLATAFTFCSQLSLLMDGLYFTFMFLELTNTEQR